MNPRFLPLFSAAALLLLARGAPSLSFGQTVAAGQPTVITCDDFIAQSHGEETLTDCTGHVVVIGNNLRITCDKMHVVSTRTGDKSDTVGKQDQIKYILATGNVRMIQGDREATCGHAEMLPQETIIKLTENPTVIDHGNNTVTIGDELDMNNNERRATGTHVRISLPPMKDLGFDKKAAPPQPDAPPAHLAPAGPQP